MNKEENINYGQEDPGEWCKRMFGRELKRIHNMKNINDNDVNNTDEYNVLHDVLNDSKHIQKKNHYFPILHGCINTHRGKKKYKMF